MAVGVVKNPLMHCKAALEDLLVSKPNQVNRLLKKVLEQCAVIMWVQHIAGSSKLYGVRMKRNGAEAPRAFHQDPTAIYATTSSETAIWV